MDTILDKILKNKMPSYKIYEDEQVIAILDIFPASSGHFLVIPKRKSKNLYDIDDKTLKMLIIIAKNIALRVTKKLNVKGFKLHINNGESSQQEIPYTHIHIIPSDTNKKLSFEEMQKLLFIKNLD